MKAFFASGHIVDLVLAITLAEAVALAIYHRRTGRGVAPADLVSTLLSGVFLMVALRLGLTGAWWGWLALTLSAALLGHVADLRRRWQAPKPVGS